MTSRTPPSARDTQSAADVVRHQRTWLDETNPGFMSGRFDGLDSIPGASQSDANTSTGTADAGSGTPNWNDSDRLTVTATGTQTFTLTDIPIDGSLFLKWHPGGLTFAGEPILPEDYSIVDNVVTLTDTAGDIKVGDGLSAQYQYIYGATPGLPDYQSLIIADTPMIYLQLGDDGAGGVDLTDSSGNGRDIDPSSLGSVTLGSTLITTLAGGDGAAVFTSADALTVLSGSWMDNLTALTLELWADLDAGTAAGNKLVSHVTSADRGWNIRATGSNQLEAVIADQTYSAAYRAVFKTIGTTLSHLVATWDVTTEQWITYLNGVAVTTLNTTGMTHIYNATGADLVLATQGTTGRLGHFAAYDYALTPTQVTEHYNTGIE